MTLCRGRVVPGASPLSLSISLLLPLSLLSLSLSLTLSLYLSSSIFLSPPLALGAVLRVRVLFITLQSGTGDDRTEIVQISLPVRTFVRTYANAIRIALTPSFQGSSHGFVNVLSAVRTASHALCPWPSGCKPTARRKFNTGIGTVISPWTINALTRSKALRMAVTCK